MKWVLSCREAAERLLRGEQYLNVWQRFVLFMHCFMCRYCTGFRQQTRTMHKGCGKLVERQGDAPGLSDEARDRVQHKLSEAQSGESAHTDH